MDRERWDREVEAGYARVLRGLVAVAGRRERAEDALQDALVAALEPGVVERIDRPDAWLFVVALRKMRRTAWRRRLEALLVPTAAAYPAPDLRRVEALELLACLTPRQREMVVARYYLDLSYREIAAHFGVSVSGATSTVTQALARMRRSGRAEERWWTSAK